MNKIVKEDPITAEFRKSIRLKAKAENTQQKIHKKESGIDFENQTIYVNRTLSYVTCKDETRPKYGKKINEFHELKTEKGKRKIPMTICIWIPCSLQRRDPLFG